jgi:Pla-1/cef family extracellular lipase
MKNQLQWIAISSVLGLAACSNDSDVNELAPVDTVGGDTPLSRIAFTPADGDLPLPSDLLFSGTADGTLETPDEKAGREGGDLNYSMPTVALGALDGWSTQMPWQLPVDLAEDATLVANSLAGRVRIFEATTSNGVDCPQPIPAGLPSKPVAELTYGVDFAYVAADGAITIAPLKPLKPATTYVLALTKGIEDSRGMEVAASLTYEIVSSDEDLSGNATLHSLQGAITVYEGVIQAASQSATPITAEDIIYSAAVTTQSVGVEFNTIKVILALSGGSTIEAESMDQTAAEYLEVPPGTALDNADVYRGTLALSNYLSNADPLNQQWTAACDSFLVLRQYTEEQLMEIGPGELNDFCQILGLGDYGVDDERHVTRYNPMPLARSIDEVEVLITVPNANINAPTPYPMVILHHGITSKKEDMLALTGALALAGMATIAIDHPLHGSRGIDLDEDGEYDVSATTQSATHYMNLANLLVARDNLRQSIADMLSLRFSIPKIDLTDDRASFETSTVYVASLSLGAMSTINFAAIANTPMNPAFDGDFRVDALSLASPGGGVAPFLAESGSFGNTVQSSILLAANTQLTGEFVEFSATPAAGCEGLKGADLYACQFPAFGAHLAEQAETEKLAELSDLISAFTFASQTVIDSADPNNYASKLGQTPNPIPIHMIEVIGDGGASKPDQVIPNQTQSLHFGGTEPLAALLGLSQITETTNGSGLVKFIKGHHTTLLTPAGIPDVATDKTIEANAQMQAQVATFLATGGTTIAIDADSEVIQTVAP